RRYSCSERHFELETTQSRFAPPRDAPLTSESGEQVARLAPRRALARSHRSRSHEAARRTLAVVRAFDARPLDLEHFRRRCAGPSHAHALGEQVRPWAIASLFFGRSGIARVFRQVAQMARDVFDRSRQRDSAAVDTECPDTEAQAEANVDAAQLARKPLRITCRAKTHV